MTTSVALLLSFYTTLYRVVRHYWFNLFLLILVLLGLFYYRHLDSFSHLIVFSGGTWVLLGVLGGLSVLLQPLAKEGTLEQGALTVLLLFGAATVIVSDHLAVVYLAVELQTFALFVLIARERNSLRAQEAALKYYILGAISSGLFLLGLGGIYTEGFPLTLSALGAELLPLEGGVVLSLTLMAAALLFKLAAAPFHYWLADVYEGCGWHVLGLVATAAKLSVLTVYQQLGLRGGFLLGAIGLSLVVGTLGALNQTKLKRLLGYSSVTHMGFLLMGFLILGAQGVATTYSYMVIYFGLLVPILILGQLCWENQEAYLIQLSHYRTTNRLLALSWALLFLSLAGIPPLSGFVSKWVMLLLMVTHGYTGVALLGVAVSAVGAAYYLRVVKMAYFQQEASYFTWASILKAPSPVGLGYAIPLGMGVYTALFLAINPQPLLQLFLLSPVLL